MRIYTTPDRKVTLSEIVGFHRQMAKKAKGAEKTFHERVIEAFDGAEIHSEEFYEIPEAAALERTFSVNCTRYTKTGYRLGRVRRFTADKISGYNAGNYRMPETGQMTPGVFFSQAGNTYFAPGIDAAHFEKLLAEAK